MTYLTPRSIHRPSDDPIFALNREATQRRAAGASVINATVGALLEDDGSLAVLPSVVEALHAVPPARGAAYAPIAGLPEFLTAVVADVLGGTPLEKQAVAVATPGGSGALRHAASLFLDRGQAVVTPSFFWGPYQTICDENERALRTFRMFDGTTTFDVAALERTLAEVASGQGRVLVFLNDPCNNPTGYALGDAEWQRVAEVLAAASAKVPTTLLVDLAYYVYSGSPRRFLPCLAPLVDRVLLLFAWSASKAFTQYGLRVGALVAATSDAAQRDAIRNALSFACRGTWSNCSAGGQIAVARCLAEPALRARVESERDRLRALLDARVRAFNEAALGTRLRYPRYEGGFFVTVFAEDAARRAARLKEQGVFVVPQDGGLRVALCGVREAEIPDLVSALDGALAG